MAFLLDKHDTVGQDCVAMCANDIICSGAAPLFFLDYIALGRNVPERVAEIVKGVADGCKLAGCALVGGETAEMPGFYPVDEYDLAGFCVGMVDKEKMINSDNINVGDKVIGISSSGVHSNGFSLVRKVFDVNKENLNEYYEEMGKTLGEALLEPTKIYVKPVLKALEEIKVKGLYKASYEVPAIFKLIQNKGNVPERDMYNTFNMGIGMAMIVSPSDVSRTLSILKEAGETAFEIGEVTNGSKEINII